MVKDSEYLFPIVSASDPDYSTETGGLLRIAIRLMMECATTNMDVLVRRITPRILIEPHSRNYIPLINLIGIYFQIRDDYMNLQSNLVCAPL